MITYSPLRAIAAAGLLALAMSVRLSAQVIDDIIPPTVSKVTFSPFSSRDAANNTGTRIYVLFSEIVDEATATDLAHYSYPGATITAATIATTPGNFSRVQLEINPAPAADSPYSVTVHDIADITGNVMDPAQTFTGTTPHYEVNLALTGAATQSSTRTDSLGAEWLGNDGDIGGFYNDGSVTINSVAEDEGWWEVDLGSTRAIGRLQVWFRTLTADECQALFNACGVRNDDFSLVILDESRNEIFRRKYAGRPPGTVAYNLPAGVSGRFVRFEAQSPRSTSDGFFSLAELAVIAPYENASIQVTQSPASVSVTENQTAKFGPVAATVTGASADRLQIQWEVNGVAIDGASASSYQTPPLSLGQDGTKYRAVFLLPGVSQPTEAATLSVTADSTPPTIASAVSSTAYLYVTVKFSEQVRPETAGVAGNYKIDAGVSVVDLVVINPTTVILTTTLQTAGKTYTLTVNGVRDEAAGAGNLIAADSKKSFRAPESDQDRFVTIGDPHNPADQDYNNGSGAQGSVAYVYQVGKYEVNNTEYAAFLNAVAKADPHTLWSSGTKILREGDDGSYTYTVQEGFEKSPVYFVAPVDAMRYVNWLNNGASESSDTETGSYTFTGYDVVGPRNSGADYFLPNENEWYKAAYYDPTKNGVGGYWLYANRTDDPNALNYQAAPGNQFSLCFLSDAGGPPDACPEDAYPLSVSYYGTFSQSGNVWEWNEPLEGAAHARPRRSGGSWGNNSARIAASVRADNPLGGGESVNQGFRVGRFLRLRPDFVTVGNPGNPDDQDYNNGSGRQGSVGYEYQIGKYEVNNTEYAMFLNAVAKSDPHTLWNSGIKITRDGEDGSYSYTVTEGFEKIPVYFVAPVDAMRFANWLNNGGAEGSDTESGSYTFTGYDLVGPRNPDARFVLPNENEWYKAAYYDPTKGGVGGYWLYANRTDDANALNYQPSPGNQFSLCFLADAGGPPDACPQDAFPLSSSYYGTFNQSGNVWEWDEPLEGPAHARPRRSGGSWGNNKARIAASVRADNPLGGGESVNQGFRIAKVPARPVLRISVEGNFAKLSWTRSGTLTSAATPSGPFAPVAAVTGTAASIPLNLGQAQYFRLE